jgi:hypothetical protein
MRENSHAWRCSKTISRKLAVARGFSSGRFGRPISANPYQAGTFENRHWERGWRSIDALPPQTAAAFDDEKHWPHAITLRYYLGASIAMVCLALACLFGLALVIFER